jgi:hypothetical protein
MHEPLFIGIPLPLLARNPWTLRGTPLLVELEGQLCKVLSSSKDDGGSILRKLLRTPRQLACMSESVAHQLLQMPGSRKVPNQEDQ